jgi:hypothetical protein
VAIIASQSTPATCGDALFNIKALLKLAGWIVAESGTGSAGTGSGVYNASGDALTTAALMTNQNAWFRIRSPLGSGTGPEFLFQNGTSNNGQIDLWFTCYGVSAPGTSSTLPTLVNGAEVRDKASSAQFDSNGTYRLWVAADNAAPYGFWYGCVPIGGGAVRGLASLSPLSTVNVGDPNPYIFSSAHYNLAYPWSNVALATAGVNNATNIGYLPPPSATNIQIIPGFIPNNQNFIGGGLTLAATTSGGGYGTDPITGKDALFPIMFARSLAISLPTWKGVTTWMRWKGTARTNGDTGTLVTARDLIHMGDVVLPWDGSVPVL